MCETEKGYKFWFHLSSELFNAYFEAVDDTSVKEDSNKGAGNGI